MKHIQVVTKQAPKRATAPFFCFFLAVNSAILAKGDSGTYRGLMEDKGCR